MCWMEVNFYKLQQNNIISLFDQNCSFKGIPQGFLDNYSAIFVRILLGSSICFYADIFLSKMAS